MIRAHRAACDRRRVLFNEVCVAEDTARQAEAALEVEEEFRPVAGAVGGVVRQGGVAAEAALFGSGGRGPGRGAAAAPARTRARCCAFPEKDARKSLRVQMLRRRGAAQLAAADAVVALVSKCAVDARGRGDGGAPRADGLRRPRRGLPAVAAGLARGHGAGRASTRGARRRSRRRTAPRSWAASRRAHAHRVALGPSSRRRWTRSAAATCSRLARLAGAVDGPEPAEPVVRGVVALGVLRRVVAAEAAAGTWLAGQGDARARARVARAPPAFQSSSLPPITGRAAALKIVFFDCGCWRANRTPRACPRLVPRASRLGWDGLVAMPPRQSRERGCTRANSQAAHHRRPRAGSFCV